MANGWRLAGGCRTIPALRIGGCMGKRKEAQIAAASKPTPHRQWAYPAISVALGTMAGRRDGDAEVVPRQFCQALGSSSPHGHHP